MTRFLLDTGTAGDYIHRRRGVYERARKAVADGHRLRYRLAGVGGVMVWRRKQQQPGEECRAVAAGAVGIDRLAAHGASGREVWRDRGPDAQDGSANWKDRHAHCSDRPQPRQDKGHYHRQRPRHRAGLERRELVEVKGFQQ